MAYYRSHRWHRPLAVAGVAAALALPTLLAAAGQDFYIGFATRVLIFALAVSSLNLVLGFGGMFSLGHAAFFGVGAYAAAICMGSGLNEALLALPIAMLAAGTLAALVGAISLRTRGVYFIMITLAFAQMAHYLVISARSWGGDDGLAMNGRMTLGGLSLGDDAALYYAALGAFVLVLTALCRLVHARFGRIIQAIRENESRMAGLGYPVARYRLTCFVLGGALAGLAGALLANQTGLASPGLLYWTQSGTLLVMLIVGGTGYLYGGLFGALALLGLEEILPALTPHWHIGLGLLLIAVVLFAPHGIAALFGKRHD